MRAPASSARLHVHPGFDLLAHARDHSLSHAPIEAGRVRRLAAFAGVQQLHQVRRPQQAAGMSRQDPIGASFHGWSP
jgi:hypothetical protein